MTSEVNRVRNRTAIAISAVRVCVEQEKVPKARLDGFIYDVSHLVYNRPGIEGHSIRLKVKDDIWEGIRDVL